jgi:hypothetical protein
LLREEKTRPGPSARDDVLFQLNEYRKEVEKSEKWSKEEKEELLRFLGMQATSWGMLSDDLRSESVRRTKERILLETWRKFTQDMNANGEAGLGEQPPVVGNIAQGNAKAATGGIQSVVETESQGDQTMLHEKTVTDSNSKEKLPEDKDVEEAKFTQ